MKLLLWLLFLFTCSQALLSLALGNSEGLQLLQDKQIKNKGFNAPTESKQRGPKAFYINRLLYSSGRAASGGGGAGRAIRGGGTSIINHPKGSGHSGASSILTSPFSIYNTLVLVSMELLLGLMFF
ncbi:hypothetical protein CKAN_00381200 [Cinnamomum micranthum f. kanehirae]|uniref:Uncharacterized protein n=1 Tax=Cinnamomum micranthum f. kanehirae TaxID=337451 RepID=A0A3S3NUI0_9MAGN|nr:hypothetical protein CKAN_00381200 [Cinnamomum micranthum f. kanehirae]